MYAIDKRLPVKVSTEDEYLLSYAWHEHVGYLRRRLGDKHIYMHQEIMGKRLGLEIDHINGDRMDNRRTNLRFVTHKENCWNQTGKINKHSYPGVAYDKRNKKFQAKIQKDGKYHWLGYFKTAKEASDAYNIKKLELFGEFART